MHGEHPELKQYLKAQAKVNKQFNLKANGN
jgi:hypothetical protein